ncbi:MAG: hypothetical protein U0469_02545 [Candidatus Paceibacterota bacterium]
MKKIIFLAISFLFVNFSFGQRTYSLETIKSLAGKGKTELQIDDSTIQTVRVKMSGQTLKIKEFGTKHTVKGDVVKAPPAPVTKENVVVTTTTTGSVSTTGSSDSVLTTVPGPPMLPVKPRILPAGNIMVNGVEYAPYTGSEAPASAPGVAKPGFLVQGGKWYKITGEVSGEAIILNGKKYSPFYPTANEHPMDAGGQIKDGYAFQNGKWWKEVK